MTILQTTTHPETLSSQNILQEIMFEHNQRKIANDKRWFEHEIKKEALEKLKFEKAMRKYNATNNV